MKYVSTRGRISDEAPSLPFRSILLEGLAADGGLAVPEVYPVFTAEELQAMRPLDYPGLAHAVLSRFMNDIAPGVNWWLTTITATLSMGLNITLWLSGRFSSEKSKELKKEV